MTVEQLIEKLRAFPPSAEVVISDADTEWELEVNADLGKYGSYSTEGKPDVVYLWGDYYPITVAPTVA